MEAECNNLLTVLLNDYTKADVSKIDEDARIDINKSILETIINKCKKYGVDTDAAFPYVDTNF